MTSTKIAAEPTRTDRIDETQSPDAGKLNTVDQQRQTAQYMADMILELRNVAKAARLFTVAVPLEYAYYEAFAAANRVEVPEKEAERLREIERAARELGEPLGN